MIVMIPETTLSINEFEITFLLNWQAESFLRIIKIIQCLPTIITMF